MVLRRSTRVSRPPDRYVPTKDYVMLMDCDETSTYQVAMKHDDHVKWEKAMKSEMIMLSGRKPSTYQEAMKHDGHVKWEKAMKSKMDSLHNNDTWDLVPLLKGKNALPCKWVFKLKNVPDDDRPKYKARVVAKGFKQEHGIDFDEIFLPVVKMTTLCMVLGLVAKEDMELVQMDVKT
ncbi:hypothetical protein L7F22_044928 [Adiantum nelumboides]|nr:hypothetical protein [Adiantum nelumboides]